MGHQRLGRLPKTRPWVQVVQLLGTSPQDSAAIASAVVEASDKRLLRLADDPSITYCFWLLARVAWAARSGSFLDQLSALGITVTEHGSALSFIADISEAVRKEFSTHPTSGHFAEVSSLALRQALSRTVGQEGPGLFTSSVQDVQRAFRTYSTPARFGQLARRFFADFMSRTLRSFVDRELANHVGVGAGPPTVEDSLEFMQALDTYAFQAARIVEEFAGGWYSKHNWESRGEISVDETQRFVAYALRKFRTELKLGAAAA